MTQPINGYNPQKYLGVNAPTPPNLVVLKRIPTAQDYKEFNIGDLWLVPQQNTAPSNRVYILSSKSQNTAVWLEIFPGALTGAIETLTGNAGGAVGPNNADPSNVNFVGNHGITIAGNPGTFTLTAAINNAITLGDVTPIAANQDALTVSTGDVSLAEGNLLIPLAEPDGSAGYIGIAVGDAAVNRVFWVPGEDDSNLFAGYQAGNITLTGDHNVGLGKESLSSITVGSDNIGLGFQSLAELTSGQFNISAGTFSLFNAVDAASNVALGYLTLSVLVNGVGNIAVGTSALQNSPTNVTGNVAIGHQSCQALTGTDTVAVGYQTGTAATTSSGSTLVGYQAGLSLATANFSTFVGRFAGRATTTSEGNTFIGAEAGQLFATGNGYNTVVGAASYNAATQGENNTIVGASVGANLLTGTSNILIGYGSGSAYTGAESFNIAIYNNGVVGESSTIRIGLNGTQTRCFIEGIRGVTTAVADAIPVLIDSAGQLGTVSSSKRYKTDIQNMADYSSRIMNLRPVCFTYVSNAQNKSWGLIAEEVHEVFPELVVYVDEKPETIKYHDLTALLLNELQKLNKRVKDLEDKLSH